MGRLLDFQNVYAGALSEVAAVSRFAPAIDVHRNTATLAALEALAANYPTIRAMLGTERFGRLARTFFALRPPSHALLFAYGEGFDRLIDEFVECDCMPFLPEVARLEWQWLQCLFAEERRPVGPGELGEITPDTALDIHPSTRLMRFRLPSASIWSAYQAADVEAALLAIEWSPETALLTRIGQRVSVTIVGERTAAFLRACSVEKTLLSAAACVGPDIARAAFAELLNLHAFAFPDQEGTVDAD